MPAPAAPNRTYTCIVPGLGRRWHQCCLPICQTYSGNLWESLGRGWHRIWITASSKEAGQPFCRLSTQGRTSACCSTMATSLCWKHLCSTCIIYVQALLSNERPREVQPMQLPADHNKTSRAPKARLMVCAGSRLPLSWHPKN